MSENEKLHKLLIKKAEQVQYGAQIVVDKIKDWQVIKQYMCNRLNDIELTDIQQKKLERYQFAYNQLVSGKYTDTDVVNQLIKLFKIKTTQAYEDLNCCRELFNSVINVNKQFEISNELQIAKAARAKCLEIFDFKNAAALLKVIQNLIAMLPDQNDNPGELFEGHVIEAVFDPALLGAPKVDMKEVLTAINAKRNVPIKIDMFEELDNETIDNGSN